SRLNPVGMPPIITAPPPPPMSSSSQGRLREECVCECVSVRLCVCARVCACVRESVCVCVWVCVCLCACVCASGRLVGGGVVLEAAQQALHSLPDPSGHRVCWGGGQAGSQAGGPRIQTLLITQLETQTQRPNTS